MYRTIFTVTFLLISFFCFFKINVFAIENPFSTSNNKFGVHILFPEEIRDAAKLVNSNGGDWGYVTIPIQGGDRNLVKWQRFMHEAKELHVIPIIRIATEGDYFNTKVWRKPTDDDIVDFGNFLDSLDWPIKNRYVVIFNEVNRSDEWGGILNPSEYAQILEYAVSFFKSKNEDFFVISAGLDNAAANSKESMNEYDFMNEMNNAVPGIFNKIDGLGSHSYPNPGFSKPPSVVTSKSISSFKFEKNLAENLSGKTIPVFITETGWSLDKVDDSMIGFYYEEAFKSVWSDENIVAVTPFLLRGGGPFAQFSLVDSNGFTLEYKAVEKIQKTKGSPKLAEVSTKNTEDDKENLVPTRDFFEDFKTNQKAFISLKNLETILKWLIKM